MFNHIDNFKKQGIKLYFIIYQNVFSDNIKHMEGIKKDRFL